MKLKFRTLVFCSLLAFAFSSCEFEQDLGILMPQPTPPQEEEELGSNDNENSNGIVDVPVDWYETPAQNARPHPIVINPKNKKGTFHRIKQ